MSIIRGTLLVAALIATAPTHPLSAQAVQPSRSGFGMSLGLGQGSAAVTCKGCEQYEEDRLNGLSGYLRVGSYVSPKFFVGVEGTGWLKNSNSLERRIAAVSLVFLGYPSPTGGFFVRSGGGVIRAVIEEPSVVAEGNGFTWQVGVGYDIGFGAVAFTPYVTYLNSTQVALTVNDVKTNFDVNPNILQIGLALTLR